LGGADTIQKAVDNAVTALKADPTLSNVFAVVGTDGHRSDAQLKSCLDAQFSTLMGYPLPYPSKTLTRGSIVKARNMRDSHKNLNLGITQAQFDKFVSILATSLVQTGVPQSDVNALAPSLTAMASDIVGNAKPAA
jgi:truncated hemoglobin YjbI